MPSFEVINLKLTDDLLQKLLKELKARNPGDTTLQ
jgi:hypothetical protein